VTDLWMTSDGQDATAARRSKPAGSTTPPFLLGRREFLIGVAGATATLAAGCTADRTTRAGSLSATKAAPAPAHASSPGRHQAGITTPPQASAILAAFDITVTGSNALVPLFRALSTLDRRPIVSNAPADQVNKTLAIGVSLFDRRFGLAALRPKRLTRMPLFPNDALDPSWCHGDLLLQICARDPKAARAALHDLRSQAKEMLQPRWSITGFRPENALTPAGVATTRNLFGFREGAGNPDPRDQALMERLVWVQPVSGEPAWTAGGSYQVVRLIRFATQLWVAEPVEHQEAVFGRHKQTGAPLGGSREDQVPNFAVDPDGKITPLDAHIRRANPRTPETDANRILRRSYSYRRGHDAAGRPDEGLVFVCFQQDLERGFATIQRRLRGEALEKYVLPFGGGYFFVLPDAPPGGYLGQQLLEAAG
jgi:deferrochelatase/peroxidase EfeB